MNKTSIFLFSGMTIIATFILCVAMSCSNEVVNIESENSIDSKVLFSKITIEDINKKELSNILLTISGDKQLVNDLHVYVKESLEFGLDEIAFVDEIMNPDKYSIQFRSTSKLSSQLKDLVNSSERNSLRSTNEKTFSIEGLEIYWPYSENWDGETSPLITFLPSDEEYFDNYSVIAYKISTNDDGYIIDSLLVDEEYAMKNPVWVIRNQSIGVEDLIDLKRNRNFGNRFPRNEKLNVRNVSHTRTTTPYMIAETAVTTIKSEKQHDDWLNGGSEYVIYWFFPVKDFGLSTHKTGQIQFSRKEIKNKTTRNIYFIGNYDWDKGQSHNRLKIIEFDPGGDRQFNVKLSTSYKEKDAPETINGEFSTTIKINNQDDHITEQTIPRTVMFTNQTKIDDKHYQKSFSENGVTVNVKISGTEGLEF